MYGIVRVERISVSASSTELNLAKNVSRTVGLLKISDVDGEDCQVDDRGEEQECEEYDSKGRTVPLPAVRGSSPRIHQGHN